MDVMMVEDELGREEKDLLMDMKVQLENDINTELIRSNTAYTLAFVYFYPWNNAQNRLRKKYWSEIGGLKVLVDALRRTTIGEHNLNLKLNLASAIWCYGESEQYSLEVVNAGAVSVAISLLKSDFPEVVQKGVGMLMGFIVHEELLDMMVEEGVIDVFADLALKLDESSISHGDSSRLMATIQSTTNNYNCRGRLLKITPTLVKLLSKYSNYYMVATLNHCGAVLAALSEDDRIYAYVSEEEISKALHRASKRLKVDEVAKAETTMSYVWTYFNRFIPLFLSCKVLVRRYGAFSMAYLSISEANRTKIINQGLLGWIQMMTFSSDSKTKKFAQSAMRRFNAPFVASLRTFAHWSLLQHVGTARCKQLVAECNIAVQY